MTKYTASISEALEELSKLEAAFPNVAYRSRLYCLLRKIVFRFEAHKDISQVHNDRR